MYLKLCMQFCISFRSQERILPHGLGPRSLMSYYIACAKFTILVLEILRHGHAAGSILSVYTCMLVAGLYTRDFLCCNNYCIAMSG